MNATKKKKNGERFKYFIQRNIKGKKKVNNERKNTSKKKQRTNFCVWYKVKEQWF